MHAHSTVQSCAGTFLFLLLPSSPALTTVDVTACNCGLHEAVPMLLVYKKNAILTRSSMILELPSILQNRNLNYCLEWEGGRRDRHLC